MFFSQQAKDSSNSVWKSKEAFYQKDSARKERQTMIQSQRNLNFCERIEWRMNINAFKSKLTNTLFAISQEPNWRQYIGHMNLLVSSFHNSISEKKASNIQDINKIKDFKSKFQKLFLLKDSTLHNHLILLLKMLLAFNDKYHFMEESTFSQILAESVTHSNNEALTEVVWILAQIEVSSSALIKLLRNENLPLMIQTPERFLLPILTIIANFISNPKQTHHVVQQLITSSMFQKVLDLGLESKKTELLNETILVFNNGLCFSPFVRNQLLKQQRTVLMLMGCDCQQKSRFLQIMRVLGLSQQQNNV